MDGEAFWSRQGLVRINGLQLAGPVWASNREGKAARCSSDSGYYRLLVNEGKRRQEEAIKR